MERLGKGMILPIYKKRDKKNCQNYKGITLPCVAQKVYKNINDKITECAR